MVMTISPNFQLFSNYFKSAWDFLSNHHTNNNVNNNEKINSLYNNNSDNSIIEISSNNVNNNNNNNNENNHDILFEDFSNNNINDDINLLNNIENENNNNDNNKELSFQEELINEEKELIQFINLNKEITQSNYYIYRVLSWLLQHDPLYIMNNDNHDIHQLINHSIECTKTILEIHEIPLSCLPIAIKYADSFVVRCGINSKQITNLLISAAIVTVKFFGETICVDHRILGRYFGLSNKDLCYMERLFLNGINFELYINKIQILNFLDSIQKEKETFVLEGQILN